MTYQSLLLWILLLLSSCGTVLAGSPIEIYIREALENNLRYGNIVLADEEARLRVTQAKASWLPASTPMRMTRADGGRIIEFPAGDMLNPVYNALNMPVTLENIEIPLLREKETDASVTLTQPLWNPAIYHGVKTATLLAKASGELLEVERQNLIREVATAYYNYLRAQKAVEIQEAALELWLENLRVTGELIATDMATDDVLLRVKVGVADQQAALEEAKMVSTMAAREINHLVGRESQAVILTNGRDAQPGEYVIDLRTAIDTALKMRGEFRALDAQVTALRQREKSALAAFQPTVGLAATAGRNQDALDMSAGDDYWTVSAVLSWNLFKGGQDHLEWQMKKLNTRELEQTSADVTRMIEMETEQAWRAYQLDLTQLELRRGDAATHARENYRLVVEKYRAGLATQLELTESQTLLKSSDLARSLAEWDIRLALLNLKRAMGICNLESID